jgi:hypothetical protein
MQCTVVQLGKRLLWISFMPIFGQPSQDLGYYGDMHIAFVDFISNHSSLPVTRVCILIITLGYMMLRNKGPCCIQLAQLSCRQS